MPDIIEKILRGEGPILSALRRREFRSQAQALRARIGLTERERELFRTLNNLWFEVAEKSVDGVLRQLKELEIIRNKIIEETGVRLPFLREPIDELSRAAQRFDWSAANRWMRSLFEHIVEEFPPR